MDCYLFKDIRIKRSTCKLILKYFLLRIRMGVNIDFIVLFIPDREQIGSLIYPWSIIYVFSRFVINSSRKLTGANIQNCCSFCFLWSSWPDTAGSPWKLMGVNRIGQHMSVLASCNMLQASQRYFFTNTLVEYAQPKVHSPAR